MSTLLIVFLVLLISGVLGGVSFPAYSTYGYGFGGIMLVVLVVLLLTGRP